MFSKSFGISRGRTKKILCDLDIFSVLNILPGGVSIATDVSCKNILHNPAAAAFLRIQPWSNFSTSASRNKPFQVYRNGKQACSDELPIQRAAWKGEQVSTEELEFKWDDGVHKFAVLSACPIWNYKGERVGAVATWQDITYRKEAERKFTKIFQSSPIAIVITTLSDGRYIDVNDGFTEALGYKSDEVIGKTSADIGIWANPSDRERMLDIIYKVGYIKDMETTLITKAGLPRVFLLSADTVQVNEKTHLIVGAYDITARRNMERELIHLDRMTLIGQLAAGISHEIRNPLTTVRGYLQVLGSKEATKPFSEQFIVMLEEIDRANAIITEFLSLAKNKATKLSCQDINTTVHSLRPLIEAEAHLQGKLLSIELQAISSIMMNSDEIRQVIINLVRNALDASPEGTTVTISTVEEEEAVILSVADEGSGIPPNILNQVGTPFFTTKDTGSGLGLAVCYGIAARHKAKLVIDTGADGTIVRVRFPIWKFHSTEEETHDCPKSG